MSGCVLVTMFQTCCYTPSTHQVWVAVEARLEDFNIVFEGLLMKYRVLPVSDLFRFCARLTWAI